MFAGFVAWTLHVQLGINCPLTLVLAVTFGFLLGCLTDRVAFRPVAKSDVVSLVLATVVSSDHVDIAFVLRELARLFWGGKADYLSPGPIIAVLAGTMVIIFTAFFRLSHADKMMQAIERGLTILLVEQNIGVAARRGRARLHIL